MRRRALVSAVLLGVARLGQAAPGPDGRIGIGLVSRTTHCPSCVIVVERAIASMISRSRRWLPMDTVPSLTVVRSVRRALQSDDVYLVVASDSAVELLVRMPVAPVSQIEVWRQLEPLIERIGAGTVGSVK